MLLIKENKLKTSGILITDKVYVRVAFTTRFGENSDTQPETHVKSWIQYKAWGKTIFDEQSINAPTFVIDNLQSEIIVDLDKTLNYGWIEFNQIFKQYMIDTLGLTSDDITIVGF
jgi:hypothetical protein